MMGPPMHHPHHYTRRFYLLLTTVVVGAILILLLMNDEGKLSLTGSSVGISLEGEEEIEEEEILEEMQSKGEKIGVRLGFDTGPDVEEETRLKSLELVFEDLSTKIKVNEEELELKGLEKVEMGIEDFQGEVIFDEVSVSLKGEGGKIVINGIEISTKGDMDISFSGLVYEELRITGIKLEGVEFGKGSGELALGEKLNYLLEEEKIGLKGFAGDIRVGGEGENLVGLEGEISGVVVEGEFDLTFS